ncbi:hypothetical protein HDV00_002462 [Rhizophlyctis rosea]|nr:hypothetical protein HDV00_002462 [Rhizophlyctis rosea]
MAAEQELSEIPFPPDPPLVLYELFPVATYSPDSNSNDPANFPTPTPSNPPTYATLTTLHRRIFKSLTSRLVRTLEGLVVSPSIPPALVQLLAAVRPSWTVVASPSGECLALLKDAELEIWNMTGKGFKSDTLRAVGTSGGPPMKSNTSNIYTVPLDRDGFPSWRRVAWSPDSSLLAVSGSNGEIQVISVEGEKLCFIASKVRGSVNSNEDIASPDLPTKPILVDWKEIGVRGGGQDPVGIIDPIASLLFVKSRRRAADGINIEHNGQTYTHELLAVTYDGILRSYLINANKLRAPFASMRPEDRDNPFLVPPITANLSSPPCILRESTSHPGRIVLYHKFSFRRWHSCVCAAVVDYTAGVLWLSGKGGRKSPGGERNSKVADGDGDDATVGSTGYLSEWRLTTASPFYAMKGVEVSDSEADGLDGSGSLEEPSVDSDDGGGDGFWRNIRKTFTVESVLDSLRPARRKAYLETVHGMAVAPDGRYLLTVDCEGSMKLWQARDMRCVKAWSSTQIVEALSSSGDTTIAEQPDNSKLIAASWWSNSSIILTFSQGAITIVTLPSLTKLLFHPESFHPLPTVTSITSSALFVLHQESKRVKIRDNNVIAADDEDDSGPSDALQKSLLDKTLAFVTSPIRLFTSTVLWHWEDNVSPSTRHTTTTLQIRNITLTVLLRITPLEALRSKIAAKDYAAALSLAQKCSLSENEIYISQWEDHIASGAKVTEEGIRDVLGKVGDRKWVLDQCLETVPEGVAGARLLLQYGVKLTGGVGVKEVEAEIQRVLREFESDGDGEGGATEEEGKEGQLSVLDLCLYRIKFLRFLDRLETHEAIYAGTDYDVYGGYSTHFGWFRETSLPGLAFAFAMEENFRALEVLFTRHGAEILPWRFSILQFVPEVVDIVKYKSLLPRVDARTGREVARSCVPWRKSDWTSTPVVKEFVGVLETEDDENDVPEGAVKMPYPAEKAQVARFYAERAREIEKRSGVVDFALDLLRVARSEFGVVGEGCEEVEGVFDSLLTLSAVVYEADGEGGLEEEEEGEADSDDVCVSIGLAELERKGDVDVVRLLLRRSGRDGVVRDFRKLVMPFLERRWRAVESEWAALGVGREEWMDEEVKEILEEFAEERVELVAGVVGASGSEVPLNDRLIKSPKVLAECVVECAYKTRNVNVDDVEVLRGMVEVAQGFSLSRSSSGHAQVNAEETKPLKPAVSWEEELEAELEGLDGLDSDGEELKKDDTVESEMHTIPDPALQPTSSTISTLPLAERLKLLASHILASQILLRYGLHKPLSFFLSSHESSTLQRQLMLLLARQSTGDDDVGFGTGGQERFENDDEWEGLLESMLELWRVEVIGRVKRGEVYEVFLSGVLGSGTKYHAPYSLKAPDLEILPIQIRLHPDRLSLIRHVLGTHPRAYRQTDEMIDLGKKLLGPKFKIEDETLVRAMCADSAMDAHDTTFALVTCEEMIRRSRAGEGGVGTLVRGRSLSWGEGGVEKVESAEGEEVVWKVCVRVAKGGAGETSRRERVLGHALRLCGNGKVEEIVGVWKDVEREGVEKTERKDLGVGGGEGAVHEFYAEIGSSGVGTYGFDAAGLGSAEIMVREKVLDGQPMTEDNLIALAKEAVNWDEVMAVGYLLELSDETRAKSFFDALSASPHSEALASYYYSLRALMHVFSSDREALKAIRLYSPADVIAAVAGLAGDAEVDVVTAQPKKVEDTRQEEEKKVGMAHSVSVESLGAVGDWGDVDVDVDVDIDVDESENIPAAVAEEVGEADIHETEQDVPSPALAVAQPSPTISHARSPSGQDTAVMDKVRTAITLSRHHALEVEQKRRDATIQSVLPPETDIARFRDDESYRREAVLELARGKGANGMVWEERLVFAAEWGVEVWDLELERIRFGLVDGEVASRDVGRWEGEAEKLFSGKETEVWNRFGPVHGEIRGTQLDKLQTLYRLLLSSTPGSNPARQNLSNRLQAVQDLQQSSIGKRVDFKDVVEMSAAEGVEDAYVGMWKDLGGGKEVLQEMARIMESLVRIKPLSQFADEKDLVDAADVLDPVVKAKRVVSRLYKVYAQERTPNVGWEYLEEERVNKVVREIVSALQYLIPDELVEIVRSVTVNENAYGIPINQRLSVVEEAERVAAQGVDADNNSAVFDELKEIGRHIRLVAAISSVQDVQTSETVAVERVRQFDEAFGKGMKQLVVICLRMIIAGTLPTIMHEVSKILEGYAANDQRGANSAELLAINFMYAEALRCIVGKPSHEEFGKVFRKGVDSPVAALERVVGSVVGHGNRLREKETKIIVEQPVVKSASNLNMIETGSSTEESGEGWDVGVDVDIDDVDGSAEGWDVDVDVDIDDIDAGVESQESAVTGERLKGVDVELEEVLKDGLKNIAEQAEIYGGGMAMEAVALLQKWFVLGDRDAQKFQKFKLGAIVKGAWGIEIPDTNITEAEAQTQLFDRLLTLTTTAQQAQSLVAVLAEFLAVATTIAATAQQHAVVPHLQDCWKRLFIWMTEHGEFEMLAMTRVEFDAFDMLNEAGDMALLDALRKDRISEYYKHLFLSHRDWLATSAGPDLRSRVEDPSMALDESLRTDRLLHILICARGLAAEFVSTPLWDAITSTLLSRPSGASQNGGLRGVLIKSVAGDLVSRGRMSAAAALTFGYLRSPREVAVGLDARVGVLLGLLGSNIDIASQEDTAADGIEGKILRRFIGNGEEVVEACQEVVRRITHPN